MKVVEGRWAMDRPLSVPDQDSLKKGWWLIKPSDNQSSTVDKNENDMPCELFLGL